ncbi:MAG: aldose epimerase family protein [Cytophagales bacterium]
MKKVYFLIFFLIIISCENTQKNKIMPLVTIEKKAFGRTLDGVDIDQYILKNRNGMEISAINYGGIITSWKAKDREGNYKDIVLGFNKLSEYESESPYFGAIIGRYGNRIAKGKFTLNGEKYTLAVNNGENNLHGGLKGFDKVVWDSKEVVDDSTASLVLSYVSNDMEEGYPGNLEVQVIYTLNNNDELSVKYEAVTDKTTIINLTQHSYFNLSADFNKNILDHDILINADSFLPVDSILIPTGEIRNVGDTPFDFRRPKNVGEEINNANNQLMIGNGYDHCWVLNNQNQGLRFVASAYDSGTGRLLEVFSDQPGIQFYSGNFLDGTLQSKIGGTYDFRSGFCLETQHYPNSPNEKSFPSVTLSPGEKYVTETIFKFSSK